MFAKVLIIFGWSLVSSLATVFAFAMSISGKVNGATLFLPAVASIATIFGGVAGVILCPYMYWCLRGRNVVCVILMLIIVAIILVSLITIISPRAGLIGSVVYWSLSLLAVRLWGQRS